MKAPISHIGVSVVYRNILTFTLGPKLSCILYQFRISPVTHTIVFLFLFRRALKSLCSAMHVIWVFIPTELPITGTECTLRINVWLKYPLTNVAVCELHSEVLISNQGSLTTHPDRFLVVFFSTSNDVVGMVSRQRAGRPTCLFSIPGHTQEISHTSRALDWLWSPTSLLVNLLATDFFFKF